MKLLNPPQTANGFGEIIWEMVISDLFWGSDCQYAVW